MIGYERAQDALSHDADEKKPFIPLDLVAREKSATAEEPHRLVPMAAFACPKCGTVRIEVG